VFEYDIGGDACSSIDIKIQSIFFGRIYVVDKLSPTGTDVENRRIRRDVARKKIIAGIFQTRCR
jgi:hypothetical protein